MNLFDVLDRIGGRTRAGRVLVTYAVGASFVSIVGQVRELVTTSLRASGWQPPAQPCAGCTEKAAAQLEEQPPAESPADDAPAESPFAGDELPTADPTQAWPTT